MAAETVAFQRHTTHDEMMAYLVDLRATSTDIRLATYGESREGRPLPYAIFSRPLVSQPWEAALLGKPIVLLAGNVHGGEPTLRESLLILMRELATAGTPENRLLDDMVVLVAPQINPDGFHTGARGTRGNAWGIDLKRDYINFEHPEIASYVRNLVNGWHPHLFVDGHNGGSFPYNINYQCRAMRAPILASHSSAMRSSSPPSIAPCCSAASSPGTTRAARRHAGTPAVSRPASAVITAAS